MTPELQRRIARLVARAMTTGERASEVVARARLHDLTDAERRYLIRIALTALVNGEIAAVRYGGGQTDTKHELAEAKETRNEYMARITDLHDRTLCTFSTHYYNFGKRESCVSNMLTMEPGELDAEMARRRAQNQERAAQSEVMEREYHAKLNGIFERHAEEVVREAFEKVSLVGADGVLRTLWDFRLEDVEAWESKATTMTDSWGVRADWFARMAETMRATEAKTVADVDPAISAPFSTEAIEIWQG